MKPKILYIDDELQNLVGFKASFREGFDIITLTSAVEGLKFLKNESTDTVQVIISDQRMPEMSGDEFFIHIPKKHQHATRILLTAFADISTTKKAINKGKISFFYTKPYDEEEFNETLHHACRLFNKKIQLKNEIEQIHDISKFQIQKIMKDYEESRDVFSEELHEGFAQKLAGLKMFLQTLEFNTPPTHDTQVIKKINDTLSETIVDIRDICFKVMPRSVKHRGIGGALSELIKKNNNDKAIQLQLKKCDLPKLSVESHFVIYRIVEEVLNSLLTCSDIKLIVMDLTLMDNLLIIFDNKSTLENWTIKKTLKSKIEAYNGKIILKKTQLKLAFTPFT